MDAMNRQMPGGYVRSARKVKSISEKYARAGLDIPDAAIKEIENIKLRNGR